VQRFYLRKIEGADVLLTDETNLLRQELHKWAPVAPEPPRMIEVSLSTRKPRPTKQQKLMAQLGITNPDDLPVHLRPKQPGIKKKEKDDKKVPDRAPTEGSKGETNESHTPPGSPHAMSTYRHGSHASVSIPEERERQSTFSYDTMAGASSFAQQDSPIFTTSSHHALTGAGLTSPVTQTHGIDPSLENMFGRPSSSTNDKVDTVRPPVFQSSAAEERSDPLEMFVTLTSDSHDPDTSFGGAFGSANSAFVEDLGPMGEDEIMSGDGE